MTIREACADLNKCEATKITALWAFYPYIILFKVSTTGGAVNNSRRMERQPRFAITSIGIWVLAGYLCGYGYQLAIF